MTLPTPRLLGATALASGSLAAGLYLAQTPAPAHPSASARRAVTALVTEPPAVAQGAIPSDFTAVNGYLPRVDHGHLADPAGGCSSPVPLPAEFEPVCRQHDLGYDLLRTATATGGTLPGTARREIDHQFAAGLHRACDDRGGLSRSACDGWAQVATAAVEVNSWRQHWSDPGAETPLSIAGIAAVVLAILSASGVAALGTRRLLAALLAHRPCMSPPAGSTGRCPE